MNEQLKKEIKERMKLMGIAKEFIDIAIKGDVVIFERQNKIFSDVYYSLDINKSQEPYTELYLAIERLRVKTNLHTYMVQLTHTEFGDNYSLFYVDLGQSELDWQVEKKDIQEKWPYVYVWNATEPLFSEFGRIGIAKGNMGGIIRTA